MYLIKQAQDKIEKDTVGLRFIIRIKLNRKITLGNNQKKDALEVAAKYIDYHLEDIRVRNYYSLKNTVALLSAVFYFLSVYLGRKLKLNILLRNICEKAKRFFQIPLFNQYALADGIYKILFNTKWSPRYAPGTMRYAT